MSNDALGGARPVQGHRRVQQWPRAAAALALGPLLLMAACGGGGGGSAPAPVGETVNGIAVPPAPDPVQNAATVPGVDADRNGVRDDIDRLLARDFVSSASTPHAVALRHARTQQAALSDPSAPNVEAHLSGIRCAPNAARLDDLQRVTSAALDTSARRRAYAQAFAGAVLSSGSCP